MAFLERIHEKFQNYLISEMENAEKTLLFSVSPLIKFISTLWFLIFTNYIVSNYFSWIFIDIFCLISVIFLKIPIKRYFRSFLYLGLLIPTVIALPLIFLLPGTPLVSFRIGILNLVVTQDGFLKASQFVLRFSTNISILGIFLQTTPFSHIIHIFNQLKFPKIFQILLTLTYRYFYLFFSALVKILRADSCRRFEKYPFKKRFNHIGLIFGMLLLRSLNKGERIYKAMQARGYSGNLPVLNFKTNYYISLIYIIVIIILTTSIWILFLS